MEVLKRRLKGSRRVISCRIVSEDVGSLQFCGFQALCGIEKKDMRLEINWKRAYIEFTENFCGKKAERILIETVEIGIRRDAFCEHKPCYQDMVRISVKLFEHFWEDYSMWSSTRRIESGKCKLNLILPAFPSQRQSWHEDHIRSLDARSQSARSHTIESRHSNHRWFCDISQSHFSGETFLSFDLHSPRLFGVKKR